MSIFDFLFGNTAPAKEPIPLPSADNSGTGNLQIQPMVTKPYVPPPVKPIPPPTPPSNAAPSPSVQPTSPSIPALPSIKPMTTQLQTPAPMVPKALTPISSQGSTLSLNNPLTLKAATDLMKQQKQIQDAKSSLGGILGGTESAAINLEKGAYGAVFHAFGGKTANSGEQEALAQDAMRNGDFAGAQKILAAAQAQHEYDKGVDPETGKFDPAFYRASQSNLLNSLSYGLGEFVAAAITGGETGATGVAEDVATPLAGLITRLGGTSKAVQIAANTAKEMVGQAPNSVIFSAMHSTSPQDFVQNVPKDFASMFPWIAGGAVAKPILGAGMRALAALLGKAVDAGVTDVTPERLQTVMEGGNDAQLAPVWKSLTGEQRVALLKAHADNRVIGENRMINKTGPEDFGEPKPPVEPIPATPKSDAQRIQEVQQEIEDLQKNVAAHEEMMKGHGDIMGLQKYTNKRTGELPEVSGKTGGSKFAQTGDQIALDRGSADSEEMRAQFAKASETQANLQDLQRQLANKKIELQHLQKAAQAPEPVTRGAYLKMAKNADIINSRGDVHPAVINESPPPPGSAFSPAKIIRRAGAKKPIEEPNLSPAEEAAMRRFEDSLSPADREALDQNKPMDRTIALQHIRQAREELAKMPEGPAKEMQKEAIAAMQKKAETYGQQQHRLLKQSQAALKQATKDRLLAQRRADAHEMNRLQKDITTMKRQALRMPIDVQKQMLDIAKNHREDATLPELRKMKEDLTQLHAMGAVKNRMRLDQRDQRLAEMRSKFLEGIKKRKYNDVPEDNITQFRLKNMQPDVALDSMGPNVWNMTKGKYEEGMIKAMKDAKKWIDEHNAIVKKYQLTPEEYRRIDIYAKDQRSNNKGRLDRMGFAVPDLTDKEFAAYQELQKHMALTAWEQMLATHNALNPTTILKQDPHYWISPTLRDENSLATKIIRNDATVQDSFAHNTIGGQDVALSMDPVHDIPKGFMARARYIHTAQMLNEMHAMIDDPKTVIAMGKMNADYLDNWMRKTANNRNMLQDVTDMSRTASTELGRRLTQSFMFLNYLAGGKHLSLAPANLAEVAHGTNVKTAAKAAVGIIRNIPNSLIPKLNYAGINDYLAINPELAQKLGNVEQYMQPEELPRIRDQEGIKNKITAALLRRPVDWFPQWVQGIGRYFVSSADRAQQIAPAMMMHDFFLKKGLTPEEAVVQTNKILRRVFPGYTAKDQPAVMDEPLAKPFQILQYGNMGRASTVRDKFTTLFGKSMGARERAYAALSLSSFFAGTLIVNWLDTLGIPDQKTREQAQADILSPKGLALAAGETPFITVRAVANAAKFLQYGMESTGAPILDTAASIMRGAYYAATGKKEATVQKNKFRVIEGLGELGGVPKKIMDVFKPTDAAATTPTDAGDPVTNALQQ